MVSYAHILPIIVCFFILTSLRRFWLCIGRFGALKEVSRRAPELIQSDLLAAATAVMPFLLALADWLQIVPPRATGPISSTLAVLIHLPARLPRLFWFRRPKLVLLVVGLAQEKVSYARLPLCRLSIQPNSLTPLNTQNSLELRRVAHRSGT